MTATAQWALPEMTALAAMREDWDRSVLAAALDALREADWPAGRAISCLAQAIADPQGSPRDLLSAAQATTGRPMARRPAAPHVVSAIRAHYEPAPASTEDSP